MWNNALKLFIEMKRRVKEKYGEEKLWDYEGIPCMRYWAELCPEFQPVLEPLMINEYKNFILLKYTDLEDNTEDFWNRYDGLYRECRSVVIDIKNDCLAMAPYRKFFNVNEQIETSEENVRNRIDNAVSVEFSDKMDGSMQSARFYNGEYILAGSQALDPALSFRVEYGYNFLTEKYKNMLREYPDYTFVFEFIHHEDQHLVLYEQEGLYLTGMRSIIDGKCLPYRDVIKIAEDHGVLHTVVFDKTLDECMSELDARKSNEAEGWVIDIDGYKVKLKYNDYVSLNRYMAKALSPNLIIQCIHDGTLDDIRSKLPIAYQNNMDVIASEVKNYLAFVHKTVYDAYNACKKNVVCMSNDKDSKKAFAAEAKKYKTIMPYIMNLYYNRENDFLAKRGNGFVKLGDIRERRAIIEKEKENYPE